MIGLNLSVTSRRARPSSGALHQQLTELSMDWINLCIGDDIAPDTGGLVQTWPARVGAALVSTGTGRHTAANVAGRRGISSGMGTQALGVSGATVPRSIWVVAGPPSLPFTAGTFPAAAKTAGFSTEVAGLIGQAGTSSWRTIIGPRYKNGVVDSAVGSDILTIYSGDDSQGATETGFRIGAFYADGTWPFTAPILFAGALSSVPSAGLRADITSALKRYYLIP